MISDFSRKRVETVKFANSFENLIKINFNNENFVRFCASIQEKDNFVEVVEMNDINIEFQLDSFYNKNVIEFSKGNKSLFFSQSSNENLVVFSNIITPLETLNLLIHMSIEFNSNQFCFGIYFSKIKSLFLFTFF